LGQIHEGAQPGKAQVVSWIETMPESTDEIGVECAIPRSLGDLDCFLCLLIKDLPDGKEDKAGRLAGRVARHRYLNGIETANVDIVVEPLLHLAIPR